MIFLLFFWSGTALAESRPISFDEALDRIVGRSTGIAAQKATLEGTRAKNLPTRLRFLPTVSLNARKSWQGGEDLETGRNYRAEAASTLNLFRFGADFSNWKAADADERTQEFLLSDRVLRSEEAAVRSLVALIRGEQEIRVYERIANLEKEIHQIGRARFQRGLLASQEVDRVSIDLDNATARLADARASLAVSRSELVALLGDENVSIEWPWKEFLTAFRPPNSISHLSERPDVQAALARVEAEDQRHSRDVRLILPSLDADLTYGKHGAQSFASMRTEWTAGVGITFPLFDHLTRYSAARVQATVRAVAEADLEETRRRALAEFTSARESFLVAIQSAVLRDRTLRSSGMLYQDNLRRYQAGRINANDLAIDQNRLYDAELLAVQGWASAHLQYAKLCHAWGKRVVDPWPGSGL